MKRLFVFTVKYPYSKIAECFLGDELRYDAKMFDKITIVPLRYEDYNIQTVPNNCDILSPIINNWFSFIINGLFNKRAFRTLFGEFFKEKVYLDMKKLRVWLIGYVTINNILNSKKIKHIERVLRSDDVCYFYWGKWSNALAFFWKNKAKFVSRFHGFGDMWEDEYNGYVPLRKKILHSLNYSVFISKDGERYFRNKYLISNTKYLPLGSFGNGVSKRSTDGVIRVISCSSLNHLKRVPLILESVYYASKNNRIEWTHIGGGLDFDFLQKESKLKENENLKIFLLGAIPHSEVIPYYASRSFDVFVNLSTIEGVPVSIMEAISCNIPCIATDVGGTKDIVNDHTGVLISVSAKPEEIANEIINVSKHNYEARNFWERNYNADTNYSQFVSFLKNI